MPWLANALSGRRDIQHRHLHAAAPGRSAPHCVRQAPQATASISTSVTVSAADALRQREPCRAHTRAEFDRMTCAARFRRGREQDRIMPDAVAASAAGAG